MLNLNSQDFRANVGKEDSCGRFQKGRKLCPILSTAGTATCALIILFVFGGSELGSYTSSVTVVVCV